VISVAAFQVNTNLEGFWFQDNTVNQPTMYIAGIFLECISSKITLTLTLQGDPNTFSSAKFQDSLKQIVGSNQVSVSLLSKKPQSRRNNSTTSNQTVANTTTVAWFYVNICMTDDTSANITAEQMFSALQIAISSGTLQQSSNFPILSSDRIVSEPNDGGGSTTTSAIIVIIILFIIVIIIVILAFFIAKKNNDKKKEYRNTWAANYLNNKNTDADTANMLNESLTGKIYSGSNVVYVDATDVLRKQQIAV